MKIAYILLETIYDCTKYYIGISVYTIKLFKYYPLKFKYHKNKTRSIKMMAIKCEIAALKPKIYLCFAVIFDFI